MTSIRNALFMLKAGVIAALALAFALSLNRWQITAGVLCFTVATFAFALGILAGDPVAKKAAPFWLLACVVLPLTGWAIVQFVLLVLP